MTTATAPPAVPFVDSTVDLAAPERLTQRMDRDGYLFFRGLIPRAEILDVRRQLMEVIARRGWIAPGSDPMDGIMDPAAVDRSVDDFTCSVIGREGYLDVYRLQAFHQLAHHPALLDVYRSVLGDDVLPHPRNIARIAIPTSTAHTTSPHQDFIHVQGSHHTMTAWIPLGDCPVELGGLSVLEGSHQEGILSYKESQGAGALEAHLCDLGYSWAQGDFRAGDVITFDSRTVHKALPNTVPDRIRLSLDFRYQSVREPIDPSSVQPHCGIGTWDDIYSGWSDPSLQYYWSTKNLSFSAWDEAVRWQQDRIC